MYYVCMCLPPQISPAFCNKGPHPILAVPRGAKSCFFTIAPRAVLAGRVVHVLRKLLCMYGHTTPSLPFQQKSWSSGAFFSPFQARMRAVRAIIYYVCLCSKRRTYKSDILVGSAARVYFAHLRIHASCGKAMATGFGGEPRTAEDGHRSTWSDPWARTCFMYLEVTFIPTPHMQSISLRHHGIVWLDIEACDNWCPRQLWALQSMYCRLKHVFRVHSAVLLDNVPSYQLMQGTPRKDVPHPLFLSYCHVRITIWLASKGSSKSTSMQVPTRLNTVEAIFSLKHSMHSHDTWASSSTRSPNQTSTAVAQDLHFSACKYFTPLPLVGLAHWRKIPIPGPPNFHFDFVPNPMIDKK